MPSPATRTSSRGSTRTTRSSPARISLTRTLIAGVARIPLSSARPRNGSSPWTRRVCAKGRSSKSMITCAGFPPGLPTASGRWSRSVPIGASAASGTGACPSRSSSANPVERLSPTRKASMPSSSYSAPRVPMPGTPLPPRIICHRACAAPIAAAMTSSPKRTSSTSGGSPACRTRASARLVRTCIVRPTCTSRVPTSIVAGSSLRCSRAWEPMTRRPSRRS